MTDKTKQKIKYDAFKASLENAWVIWEECRHNGYAIDDVETDRRDLAVRMMAAWREFLEACENHGGPENLADEEIAEWQTLVLTTTTDWYAEWAEANPDLMLRFRHRLHDPSVFDEYLDLVASEEEFESSDDDDDDDEPFFVPEDW